MLWRMFCLSTLISSIVDGSQPTAESFKASWSESSINALQDTAVLVG